MLESGRQGGWPELLVVPGLGFGLRHVADRREEATVVVPVHPFERGVFDRIQRAPRATAVDHFRLEQADDGLGEGLSEFPCMAGRLNGTVMPWPW